ncbi:hypothetical protein R3P38DRAFT_772651 [Favolaschia claudopus]|uniref:Uncharacterized protein n=1 Tax=Favolaschia claudopus TaxID=2862362 RepID=A0AAW0C224_9AGAR
MSLSGALRSLGSRRALLNIRSMHSLHSPFGAMTSRTVPFTGTEKRSPDSFTMEFGATRLNVVASAPVDKFNGVPLGAFAVATPYQTSAEAQTTKPAETRLGSRQ